MCAPENNILTSPLILSYLERAYNTLLSKELRLFFEIPKNLTQLVDKIEKKSSEYLLLWLR